VVAEVELAARSGGAADVLFLRLFQPLRLQLLLAKPDQAVEQLVVASNHVQAAFVLMLLKNALQAVSNSDIRPHRSQILADAGFSLAPALLQWASENLIAAIEIFNGP
jgi:hypothetical protein